MRRQDGYFVHGPIIWPVFFPATAPGDVGAKLAKNGIRASTRCYLNVGACWLWVDKDYLSFDEGYRVEGFTPFEDPAQFERLATRLASRARDEVLRLRARFSSLDAIAAHLKAQDVANIWHNYHAAVAAGLSRDPAHAALRFATIAVDPAPFPWVVALKARAAALQECVHGPAAFAAAIARTADATRARLKLD